MVELVGHEAEEQDRETKYTSSSISSTLTDRIMVVAWIPEDEAKLPSGREVPGAFILETNPSQGAVLGNLQRVGVGQVLRCGTACLVSLMQCFCLKFIKRFQHSLKYQVNRESSLRKCRILCPSVGVGFQRECQA